MDKVLITGLNGITGWHSFLAAKKVSRTVKGTYRRFHASFDVSDCIRIDLDDRFDARDLLETFRPTHIVHARFMCDLDVCEELPALTRKVNVDGTAILLEEAERLGTVKKFCYVSSDHVFDGRRGRYLETDLPRPKHVYGRSKAEGERLVRKSKLPWIIVRPGLVIGKSVQGNVGPRDWLLSRLKRGKPSHLFHDEWRTPVPAGIVGERIISLLRSEQEGIFHLAGDVRISRYELGRVLAQGEGVSTQTLYSRARSEDHLSHIRPRDLSLSSLNRFQKGQAWRGIAGSNVSLSAACLAGGQDRQAF